MAEASSQDEVIVYVSQGPLGAEVAKSKLESEGLPLRLRYQSIGRVLGLTVDGLGKVEVLVPEAYADVARELLAELGDDALSSESEAGAEEGDP